MPTLLHFYSQSPVCSVRYPTYVTKILYTVQVNPMMSMVFARYPTSAVQLVNS